MFLCFIGRLFVSFRQVSGWKFKYIKLCEPSQSNIEHPHEEYWSKVGDYERLEAKNRWLGERIEVGQYARSKSVSSQPR